MFRILRIPRVRRRDEVPVYGGPFDGGQVRPPDGRCVVLLFCVPSPTGGTPGVSFDPPEPDAPGQYELHESDDGSWHYCYVPGGVYHEHGELPAL